MFLVPQVKSLLNVSFSKPTGHLSLQPVVAAKGPYLCFLPKVVPFDEIAVYRSDPRHVTKLMSRSGGLGVVITAGTHGCDVF